MGVTEEREDKGEVHGSGQGEANDCSHRGPGQEHRLIQCLAVAV